MKTTLLLAAGTLAYGVAVYGIAPFVLVFLVVWQIVTAVALLWIGVTLAALGVCLLVVSFLALVELVDRIRP